MVVIVIMALVINVGLMAIVALVFLVMTGFGGCYGSLWV